MPGQKIKYIGPGCIAQLVEQLTLNQWVQGSSPCAPTKNINRNAVLFFWSGQTGREPCLRVRQRVDLTSATWSNRHECPAAGVPHRARESLCAHHKISLTNAVSLRNFSATRSLARSVAFSLPHYGKDCHTKPDAPCGFLLHKTNGCICRILCTYSHFIISNKSMDYTLLFPYEFQNATAVHQPCPFHRLCLSSAPQKLYSHAAPS